MEEKALLGKIGRKFDTPQKRRLLYSLRLQKQIGNMILFANLYKYPELLIDLAKHIGIADDESVKYYIDKIQNP